MSNANLHAQTQEQFERIDQRLDALVDITGTQKVLATSIGNELEEQNQMLQDTNVHMDKAQLQVDKANAAVLEVKASSSQWAAWILMIVLIVAIICVWAFVKRS
ncbi:SNARE domain containing protein [Tritrichomonas foetus]|uniref:SNARE domain containing protein n=1 Tax=Tritrichomonas foetus TaxID=1144522 RepID=A0A1J4J393_9EUKA|nr:SNARE domain containing protein [Tritrichomonas foetus]|eukprot:OHS93826.1 SNARE domain containing protein [Tritrichomonas foetus]